MKVLFAVNNDKIYSEIVKKYQKEYKEILSYKNVYYFNAILREIQKDKSYSRIIISEDLEPFANNNYNSIDKFLYEKYNNITEEAKNTNNKPIDIIVICSDRRKKTDDMLARMYKKGIYNAIIGNDRSIEEVCKLIEQPRSKEEAREYYNIQESELGDEDGENSVSEAELQNILAHYKRLGRNEDKYVESFNNIVTQYTDTQLRIIIKYLPMNVKAVLEAKSYKYQQLAINSTTNPSGIKGLDAKRKTAEYKKLKSNLKRKEENNAIDNFIKTRNIKDVVIPSNLTVQKIQKIEIPTVEEPTIDIEKEQVIKEIKTEIAEEKTEEDVVKKKRGRPRKNPVPVEEEPKPKRGRGRPRKNQLESEDKEGVEVLNTSDDNITEKVKDATKLDNIKDNILEKQKKEEIDLFSMDNDVEEEQEEDVDLFSMDNEVEEQEEDVDLFSMDNEVEEQEEDVDLFSMDNEAEEEQKKVDLFNMGDIEQASLNEEESSDIISINNMNRTVNEDFNNLLTADKKIVAFVGTTKNGTSFIVNNTAEMLSSMGIKTAILDMTKSKNAYYIYTNNEESLRIRAKECMEKLQNGIPEGININKNLTVYTEMPGEEKKINVQTIFTTLLKNYSAVLIDTDFNTTDEVFKSVQEIYLVQSMDVLTIQPLTAFLRNLKSRNVLAAEKLKIVINKFEKIRSLNIKTLIGGMSCYNAPNMTYMTELFNKDNIKYCVIPFETQNYINYLDSLVKCSISLNGYTKALYNSLKELANIVYPLISKQATTYSAISKNTKEPFSNQVNTTLNKMRNKY